VQTFPLEIACPTCGARDVFYSCTPNCCFNHVCAGCGTTFEPATRRAAVGRPPAANVVPPDPLPDATAPTAACACCESTAVYSDGGGALVCGRCGAWLVLELTEIHPG
jgi:hypothetical protein